MKLNFKENVDLTIGAGGRAMYQLLNQLILKEFDNEFLAQQSDQAILPQLNGKLAFSTDSYVVSPLFFNGGDIGSIAINGTVNDLAVSGATPLYISVGFIIEEGFPLADLRTIVQSMAKAAREAKVKIVTGDTKVVEKGKGDGYIYNQLADLYYNMFNTVEAAKWYEKAVETNQDPEIYYRYAQMLKANGKYAESNVQMQKFASLVPADTRAVSFNENPNYIPRLLDKQKMFDVSGMDISSDKSDFGAVLYNNQF